MIVFGGVVKLLVPQSELSAFITRGVDGACTGAGQKLEIEISDATSLVFIRDAQNSKWDFSQFVFGRKKGK